MDSIESRTPGDGTARSCAATTPLAKTSMESKSFRYLCPDSHYCSPEITSNPQIDPVPVLLVKVFLISIAHHACHPKQGAHLFRKFYPAGNSIQAFKVCNHSDRLIRGSPVTQGEIQVIKPGVEIPSCTQVPGGGNTILFKEEIVPQGKPVGTGIFLSRKKSGR